MNPRHTFARNKAPTRPKVRLDHHKNRLTTLLLMRGDIADIDPGVIVAMFPRLSEKYVRKAIALEKARRAAREDAA